MKIDSLNSVNEKKIAEAEEKIKEAKMKLEKLVQEYPLASIAVAAGLGFVIAKMLERRRS